METIPKIVTGTKRAASQQDTPIAISTITARDIENTFGNDIRAVGDLSPNVNLTNQTGFNAVAGGIRGTGTISILTTQDPSVGMAVICDVGEANDIHPRNKLDVGKRLARWALAEDYDQTLDGPVSGPIYESHEIVDGAIRVQFEHADGGLKSRDGENLKRFEIACANWFAAQQEESQVGNCFVLGTRHDVN